MVSYIRDFLWLDRELNQQHLALRGAPLYDPE
jgi:hypothetical protein